MARKRGNVSIQVAEVEAGYDVRAVYTGPQGRQTVQREVIPKLEGGAAALDLVPFITEAYTKLRFPRRTRRV